MRFEEYLRILEDKKIQNNTIFIRIVDEPSIIYGKYTHLFGS